MKAVYSPESGGLTYSSIGRFKSLNPNPMKPLTRENVKDFEYVLRLVESGTVKPVIDRVSSGTDCKRLSVCGFRT